MRHGIQRPWETQRARGGGAHRSAGRRPPGAAGGPHRDQRQRPTSWAFTSAPRTACSDRPRICSTSTARCWRSWVAATSRPRELTSRSLSSTPPGPSSATQLVIGASTAVALGRDHVGLDREPRHPRGGFDRRPRDQRRGDRPRACHRASSHAPAGFAAAPASPARVGTGHRGPAAARRSCSRRCATTSVFRRSCCSSSSSSSARRRSAARDRHWSPPSPRRCTPTGSSSHRCTAGRSTTATTSSSLAVFVTVGVSCRGSSRRWPGGLPKRLERVPKPRRSCVWSAHGVRRSTRSPSPSTCGTPSRSTLSRC